MNARLLACLLAVSSAARAQETVPFVVAVDDGTIEATPFDSQANAVAVINAMLDRYLETGAALPEVLSVWTAFPFNDNIIETRFIPLANDVTGIGLETAFGEGQEVFASSAPPLRAMLIHNDATALADRAEFQRLPQQGFAEYLFLLELSHLWGPQIRVPTGDDVLIGFDFHWSFFTDAGGSPAGGNAWTDNGNGTFTAAVFDAPTVTFSPLDLYLMGLLPAGDVGPFGVLEDVTAPADAIDPFTNRGVAAQSFPWQGPEPLTVTATRRALTIDDVIAENGPRLPAFGDAPASFTLGIVLIVPARLEGEARDQVVRAFVPTAAALAPSFGRATGQRGSLEVIATSPAPPPAPEPAPAPVPVEDDDDNGCAQGTQPGTAFAFAAALALLRRRRPLWADPRDGTRASSA